MTTLHDLIKSGRISLETEVLGTLPITADGFIVGEGAIIWPHGDFFVPECPDDDYQEEGGTVEICLRDNNSYDMLEGGDWEACKCYSSRAAALAARSKQ